MLTDLHILARGDDDIIKLVIGAIVLIIWVISAMASSQKQKQKQRKNRQWEQTLEKMKTQPGRVGQAPLPHPPSQPPGPPRPRPQPIQRRTPQPKPQARRKPARQQPAPYIPPASEPVYAVPAARTISSRHEAEVARPASATPAASAKTIGQWLTPRTLRSQFILTEILQPPLALRDSDRND